MFVFNHINILVDDLQRSMDFYMNTLGFEYERHLSDTKVILKCGEFDFFVEQGDKGVFNDKFHFGIKTDPKTIYECYEKHQKMGVTFNKGNNPSEELFDDPNSERIAYYFEDPDGYIVEIYSGC